MPVISKCIHLLNWFDHRNHICLVSELLGMCVYDFLKENDFQPFPRRHIQEFARQLLGSVACTYHCEWERIVQTRAEERMGEDHVDEQATSFALLEGTNQDPEIYEKTCLILRRFHRISFHSKAKGCCQGNKYIEGDMLDEHLARY